MTSCWLFLFVIGWNLDSEGIGLDILAGGLFLLLRRIFVTFDVLLFLRLMICHGIVRRLSLV